jgi:hypothetical protein
VSPAAFDKARLQGVQPDATLEEFESLEQWTAWAAEHPWINDQSRCEMTRNFVREHGLRCLHLGAVPRDKVDVRDGDVLVDFLGQRERALLDLIACSEAARDWRQVRIYGAEALSSWALEMRHRYPRYLGSQFLPEPDAAKKLFPIQHQDLQALTYPSDSFDIVVSIEVLEHVAQLRSALSEMARVLRSGGLMLSTFPFRWDAAETLQKAREVGDRTEHLVPEPEYHPAPLEPKGSLVYQIPGWDIIGLARSCGFAGARFLLYSSRIGGITGQHMDGIWIFVANR